MDLYKATYYTSGVISLTAIILVALITNGNNSFLGTLLYIAYATLILIISAVLVPLILKSINNQNNKLVKIILLLLSVTCSLYFTFRLGFDLSLITLITLYLYALISFSFFFLIVPKKMLWPIIILALIIFVLSTGEETPLRDGNMLSAVGSKLVSAGLFMFYALIVTATIIMMFFGVKNMKK